MKQILFIAALVMAMTAIAPTPVHAQDHGGGGGGVVIVPPTHKVPDGGDTLIYLAMTAGVLVGIQLWLGRKGARAAVVGA